MRSAVQSCVPLQESTANHCVFLFIGIKPSRRAGHWCFWLNGKSRLFYIFCTPGTKQAEQALGLSLRSLLRGAGWRICQLRCPALSKDLCQSENIERCYFRIEWFCLILLRRGANCTEHRDTTTKFIKRPFQLIRKIPVVLHLSPDKHLHHGFIRDLDSFPR